MKRRSKEIQIMVSLEEGKGAGLVETGASYAAPARKCCTEEEGRQSAYICGFQQEKVVSQVTEPKSQATCLPGRSVTHNGECCLLAIPLVQANTSVNPYGA